MTKTVKFLIDEECEMLQVLIDGKVFGEGNFWDFNFQNDAQELLQACGINVQEGEYSYDDVTDEDDEDEQ